MKIKVGTQLEDEVYHQLKRRAAEERLPVSELLQNAVMDYLQRPKRRTLPKSGLSRLLEREPFKLTTEQFRDTLEADFYDQ